ncbi:LysR family transcriptional regulator [Kocuria flava]|uniref:LysR family transcriptional regulator n=1 Tax=Kocuria flava TaxID=446860 RepID=A0A2N4T3M0_9MICC|nr:LysR family transcriptional regulator [Kocuria flava]PLC12815.1 LysR family transcriptional regulator [Kocuria flava]
MLSLPRLRLLREVHRTGSLTAAARALNYTPSAVSQQLKLLERETGTPLLEPVGRGVRLTPAAEGLVGHTERILAHLEEAEADLAATHHEVRGTLHVAAFQSAMLTVAPTVLDALEREHPDLEVTITQREVEAAFEGLLAHEFDLIISEEYLGRPDPFREGVDRVELLRDPLHLALPLEGPWATRPRHLSDLAEAPWALDPADTPTGAWARAVCRQAGFEPRVRVDTLNPLLQVDFVRSGHAVAFVPALLGTRHLNAVRSVELAGAPYRLLSIQVRSGRTRHPAVVACRAAIVEAVAQMSVDTPQWTL